MIVVENAPELIKFVEKRLKIELTPPFQAFGYVTDDGKPIAGIVVNDRTESNCELTIVAEKGRITKGVLCHIASHVFNKLGCRRATIRTRKSNKALLRVIPRFGFVFENVAQDYYPDCDAVVFRMKRQDCPWLTV